jgi:hypothetical protein
MVFDRNQPFELAQVASQVSFGVTVDGGGFVFVNGRPHHVDPWGPMMNLAAALAAVHSASLMNDREAGLQISSAALNAAASQLKNLEQSVVENVSAPT